ncbi:MAG: acyl-CoA thioesterase [Gammaproteobacteria bacterium]|nr:acyl-CoA thioesterase [Gammaproteobacteria bacterium]
MDDSLSATVDIEIPFYDVDGLRVVWHGHYAKYFEVTRCKLLEKINYTYDDMEASGFYFPVIDLQVRYIKPIKFRQNISVTATMIEWEHRLVVKYLISDLQTGQRLTKAKTTQVAVAMPQHITQFICPPVFVERVEQALSRQ